MPSSADVAFAFLQRFCPGHPDREELRFALAALVAAEREAVREACVAEVLDVMPVYHEGDEIARECPNVAVCDGIATLNKAADALRALPLD